MALCMVAVTPGRKQWSYCSLAYKGYSRAFTWQQCHKSAHKLNPWHVHDVFRRLYFQNHHHTTHQWVKFPLQNCVLWRGQYLHLNNTTNIATRDLDYQDSSTLKSALASKLTRIFSHNFWLVGGFGEAMFEKSSVNQFEFQHGNSLTHLTSVPHLCVSELGHHWFR